MVAGNAVRIEGMARPLFYLTNAAFVFASSLSDIFYGSPERMSLFGTCIIGTILLILLYPEPIFLSSRLLSLSLGSPLVMWALQSNYVSASLALPSSGLLAGSR